MDGAHESASTKHIMHISSASCVNFGSCNSSAILFSRAWHKCCKQGKHFFSLATPPHGWSHDFTFIQELAACSWHCASAQTLPISRSPELPVIPQKRQRPTASCGPDIIVWLPSRNSTIAFRVLESAKASSQKSLVRPHDSCNSTRMASSSSLQT